MNKLEQFIKDNKDKMELSDINPQIWENIEQQMACEKPKPGVFKSYAIAASLLIGAFLIFSFSSLNQSSYFEENIYAIEVSEKIIQVKSMQFPLDYKADLNQLVNQIYYLDKQVQPKIDYINNQNYEEYINQQVLDYYQTKSQLLDKLIFEIERINTNENFNITNKQITTISI